MTRPVSFLFAVLVAASAYAGDIAEVSLGVFGGANLGFGTLTRTDWHVRDGRGADARLTLFLADSIGASVDVGRQRIESSANGAMESSHAMPEAAMLDWYGDSHGRAVPYLGAGASYLRYRQSHATPNGELAQPDHAALMTEAGVKYVLTPRWRVNTSVRFGPARSTAEVMHNDGTVEHIDFHQLYVSGAVGFAF
jgi:outer membrane protein W